MRRPPGIKATKRDDERRKRDERIAERLGDITDGLQNINEALERISKIQESGTVQYGDYILLQVLPQGKGEYM